jgi:hypothetical protein
MFEGLDVPADLSRPDDHATGFVAEAGRAKTIRLLCKEFGNTPKKFARQRLATAMEVLASVDRHRS